eukprot:ctg_1164.g440
MLGFVSSFVGGAVGARADGGGDEAAGRAARGEGDGLVDDRTGVERAGAAGRHDPAADLGQHQAGTGDAGALAQSGRLDDQPGAPDRGVPRAALLGAGAGLGGEPAHGAPLPHHASGVRQWTPVRHRSGRGEQVGELLHQRRAEHQGVCAGAGQDRDLQGQVLARARAVRQVRRGGAGVQAPAGAPHLQRPGERRRAGSVPQQGLRRMIDHIIDMEYDKAFPFKNDRSDNIPHWREAPYYMGRKPEPEALQPGLERATGGLRAAQLYEFRVRLGSQNLGVVAGGMPPNANLKNKTGEQVFRVVTAGYREPMQGGALDPHVPGPVQRADADVQPHLQVGRVHSPRGSRVIRVRGSVHSTVMTASGVSAKWRCVRRCAGALARGGSDGRAPANDRGAGVEHARAERVVP